GLSLPREFQGVLRVVGSGTGDDHAAVADPVEERAQQLALLFVARRPRLAGRPVDDQAVVAPLVDQVGREARGAVVVDAAVGQERGDHGGQHPSERTVSYSAARHAALPTGPQPAERVAGWAPWGWFRHRRRPAAGDGG